MPGQGMHMLTGDHPRGPHHPQVGVHLNERPRAGQPRAHPADQPRASSIAPSPTNGRLPDREAAAIRRANSNSTDATAEHNTSTSAAGRSPAPRPIAGTSPEVSPASWAHTWATSGEATTTADPGPHISQHRRTTRSPYPHPIPHHDSNTCTNTIKRD